MVLHQIASHLYAMGRDVFLTPREKDPWSPAISKDVPVCPFEDLRLFPEDIWLVPEGWVNALAPGLNAGARCVVYCQNWAYLFSGLPENVRWKSLKVSFLAVSHPVALFLERVLGDAPPVLRPGIDLSLFTPPEEKPSGPVRVAYMPRKNKAFVSQVRSILEARGSRRARDVIWEEISGLDQEGVAQVFQRCHFFLVTGFPEGCPLPPLEAMACGCLPVGFAGFGGFDYMRQAGEPWDGAYVPWWPLREVPWGGNGFWVADADVLALALALERAVSWIPGHDNYHAALEAGQKTAHAYSLKKQRENVVQIWNNLAGEARE